MHIQTLSYASEKKHNNHNNHFLCEVYTDAVMIWCSRACRGATTGVLFQTVLTLFGGSAVAVHLLYT